MVLKLEKDKQVYSFDVSDINKGEKLYYKFQINTSTLPDGKYSLTLYDDENIIAEDVLYIGNFVEKSLQYTKGENVYINSPFSANIEPEKTADISSTIVTIYPSEEYDGMASVKVNASAVYQNGYNSGNMAGYETGKREQKSLLEQVTITENGTYSKEDGYNEITVEVPDLNGSYDEGYQDGYDAGLEFGTENAGAAVAETAQILETTKIGTYTTKYSKPEDITEQITGDFGDGTYLYSYATTYDRGYNTEIEITKTTVVEFWYNPFYYPGGYNIIETDGGANNVYVKRVNENTLEFHMRLIQFTVPIEVKNRFYHIKMSQPDGVFIDNEKVGDFTGSGLNLGKFYIYGGGQIGMVKIDNTIFIPGQEGYTRYITNEFLSTSKPDQGYYGYYNPIISTNGNLIRTVVNRPKINVGQYDIKLGYSKFKQIPDFYDFSNISNMSKMFINCESLTSLPEINTSSVTDMSEMLNYCKSLKSLPNLITSNVTSMDRLFYNCESLTSLPNLDTSQVSNMYLLFYNCKSLISVPPLNAKNLTNADSIFGYNDLPKLTDFGGLIGLKASMTSNYGFQKVPNLTYQSCINVLNGLYDFTGHNEQPTSAQGKLKVHQNFLNLVGDEISIATNKGWTISA